MGVYDQNSMNIGVLITSILVCSAMLIVNVKDFMDLVVCIDWLFPKGGAVYTTIWFLADFDLTEKQSRETDANAKLLHGFFFSLQGTSDSHCIPLLILLKLVSTSDKLDAKIFQKKGSSNKD